MRNLVADVMHALIDFEAYVVQSEFNDIFGQEKGPELWDTFKNRCERSTTIFYRVLAKEERDKLNEYLSRSRWFKQAREVNPL